LKKLEASELDAHRTRKKEKTAATSSRVQASRAAVLVPVPKLAAQPMVRRDHTSRLTTTERCSEAIGLTQAIGLDIAFSGTVVLSRIAPATLFGTGKVAEIGGVAQAEDIAVIVVDYALTPVQQRNLEKAWNAKVLDRTGLILEIFAERARSKEGRLQVELARLTYQRSRLVRSWTHLERQRGGFGFLGGPGETQIEADRRAIGERIDTIKSELGVVERTRRLHRKRRRAARQQTVSLVGYTNAGKSTLFNALSGAGADAKDMLFATLDPTLRRVELSEGGSFILSDTVGFISELPIQLIAAFRATLEEVMEANLILHVRDIASESSEAQRIEVERVLTELGIDSHEQEKRVIEVWNKADLLTPEEHRRLKRKASQKERPSVLVSAARGEGIAELNSRIYQRLRGNNTVRDVVVSPLNGPLIHWLYENTEVLDRRGAENGNLHFRVRLPPEREQDLNGRLTTQST
jgi:GTPase